MHPIADDPEFTRLATAPALPDDWHIIAGRLVVQVLVNASIDVHAGACEPAEARAREALATALWRTLPDGVRTSLPASDAEAAILARYTPPADDLPAGIDPLEAP
jgi:hypothetical protein